MRINSPFRDYYDGAVQYSKEPFFLRQPKIEYANLPFRSSPSWSNRAIVIGFCGKLYPMLQIGNEYCRTIVDVVDTFESLTRKEKECIILNGYGYSRPTMKEHVYQDRYKNYLKAVVQYFDSYKSKQFTDIFDKYGVQFSCEYSKDDYELDGKTYKFWRVTSNCRLADFEFYRVIDTYTAAQEVEMYLNNIAWPNRPIPAVSNSDLITAKGFDKYSFRKDKSK